MAATWARTLEKVQASLRPANAQTIAAFQRIVNQSNRAPDASETGAADVPGDAPIEGHPPSTTDGPPADDDADGSGETAGQ